LDLQLTCATKIAVGSCPWTDWRPFEIWLSITWNAPNFDPTYLGIPNVKPISSYTKTKEITSSQIFFSIWDHRRTALAIKIQKTKAFQ
jgi:hypothetical protein